MSCSTQYETRTASTPTVRVVIPAYRAGATIRDVGAAVLRSDACEAIEVVVVDDGSNGDLATLLRGLPIRVVDHGPSGSAAAARNRGAQGFEGQFLVFIDADVVVDRLCLSRLLEPLKCERADATMGNYSRNVAGTTFASRYKQLYISRIYERREGYIPNDFWSAACAIKTAVFEDVQGFDPRYRGACGEDVDLGRRLTAAEYRILAVPSAIGDHRNALSLAQLIRNDWRKGVMAMKTCLRFGGSIADNRHSTSRDVLAVAISLAVLLMAILTARLSYEPEIAALAITLVLYLAARADLLRVFATQRTWFAVKACGVMYLLDLVRCACVVAAVWPRLSAQSLPIDSAPERPRP